MPMPMVSEPTDPTQVAQQFLSMLLGGNGTPQTTPISQDFWQPSFMTPQGAAQYGGQPQGPQTLLDFFRMIMSGAGQLPQPAATGQGAAPGQPQTPPQPTFQDYLSSQFGQGAQWTNVGALPNSGTSLIGGPQSGGVMNPNASTEWMSTIPGVNMGQPVYMAGPSSLTSPFTPALPQPDGGIAGGGGGIREGGGGRG